MAGVSLVRVASLALLLPLALAHPLEQGEQQLDVSGSAPAPAAWDYAKPRQRGVQRRHWADPTTARSWSEPFPTPAADADAEHPSLSKRDLIGDIGNLEHEIEDGLHWPPPWPHPKHHHTTTSLWGTGPPSYPTPPPYYGWNEKDDDSDVKHYQGARRDAHHKRSWKDPVPTRAVPDVIFDQAPAPTPEAQPEPQLATDEAVADEVAAPEPEAAPEAQPEPAVEAEATPVQERSDETDGADDHWPHPKWPWPEPHHHTTSSWKPVGTGWLPPPYSKPPPPYSTPAPSPPYGYDQPHEVDVGVDIDNIVEAEVRAEADSNGLEIDPEIKVGDIDIHPEIGLHKRDTKDFEGARNEHHRGDHHWPEPKKTWSAPWPQGTNPSPPPYGGNPPPPPYGGNQPPPYGGSHHQWKRAEPEQAAEPAATPAPAVRRFEQVRKGHSKHNAWPEPPAKTPHWPLPHWPEPHHSKSPKPQPTGYGGNPPPPYGGNPPPPPPHYGWSDKESERVEKQ